MNQDNTLSVFQQLKKLTPKVEKKGKLSYVSWADAWDELKSLYPNANYRVLGYTPEGMEVDGGLPYQLLFGKYAQVAVEVTVDGLAHTIALPVMNNSNQAMTVDKITSFDINKTKMRALTKAIALHGLGLHIFRGEDTPEDDQSTDNQPSNTTGMQNQSQPAQSQNSANQASAAASSQPRMNFASVKQKILSITPQTNAVLVKQFIAMAECTPTEKQELTQLLEDQLLMIGAKPIEERNDPAAPEQQDNAASQAQPNQTGGAFGRPSALTSPKAPVRGSAFTSK